MKAETKATAGYSAEARTIGKTLPPFKEVRRHVEVAPATERRQKFKVSHDSFASIWRLAFYDSRQARRLK